MIKDILKLLKIKHYIKNLIVFIPLIFALKFTDKSSVISELLCFVAFCLIASAVYVINDIFDKEADSNHPIKRNRPIASGRISIPLACFILVALLVLSSVLSYSITLSVLFTVIFYFGLNVLYTVHLKKLPITDVVCIALGFVLRILAGCFAIGVQPSPLVILLTFFSSMFFTFGKRKLEYGLAGDKCRVSIKEYTLQLLDQYVGINAILSIAFYFTYMLDETTIKRCGTEYLYLSVIPFVMIIYRLLFLIYTDKSTDDPATFIYKDKTLHIFMLIYVAVLLLIFVSKP